MKHPRQRFLRPMLFAMLAAEVGCSSSSAPEPPKVDPDLVGAWVHVETDDSPPQPANYGIRIAPDGTVQHLGIETATGVLREIDRPFELRILEARDGKMRLEVTTPSFGSEFSNTYDVAYAVSRTVVGFSVEQSFIHPSYLAPTYRAATLGRQVALPVPSHLDIQMDGGRFDDVTLRNPDVWTGPPVYAFPKTGLRGQDYVVIGAALGGCEHVSIYLPAVPSAGEYVLEGDAAWISYVCSGGDMIDQVRTHYVEPSGTVTIESVTGQAYKGHFEATLYDLETPVTVSGSFEAPYYYNARFGP